MTEVKATQAREALSKEEKAIRKATEDTEFNVPQPIAAYLHQVGHFTDKMGKKTELDIPALPTSRVQGHGGYHAPAITEDNHNLFEEIPSLGIAGDVVMALCEEAAEPMPNFRVERPANSVFTENLVGHIHPIGIRRPEIKQRLAGQGITATTFPEYEKDTHFNLKYMISISDTLSKFSTFRIEKICFSKLTAAGGESQVITTRPTEEDPHLNWTERTVQASSAADSTTATMGASFVFGFQTYKETGDGDTQTQQHAKWCCLAGTGADPWNIPNAFLFLFYKQ